MSLTGGFGVIVVSHGAGGMPLLDDRTLRPGVGTRTRSAQPPSCRLRESGARPAVLLGFATRSR
jgi:hypothetical protein